MQRLEFAQVGLAVLVGINPDSQIVPGRVARVDHAVGIAVQTGQCRRAGALARPGARRQEQLAGIVDHAVVVVVPDQQTVGNADPTGLL